MKKLGDNGCKCQLCEQIREFVKRLELVPEAERPFWENLYDAYLNNLADLDMYREWQQDHKRLVRELDVALNGEEGAAKQASLCDIVAQAKDNRWKLVRVDQ